MSKCWLVYSDDAPVPVGTEVDYWLKEDAVREYEAMCEHYPKDAIKLFEISNFDIDYDEPAARWTLLTEQRRTDFT
jgi:hypothetical protein